MSQHRPVVILTVPFGSAHTRTAQAITRAWTSRSRPTSMQVLALDDYLPRTTVALLLRGYMSIISRAPSVFRFIYSRGREPGVSGRMLTAAIRLAAYGGNRLLRRLEECPGVWVSTHPLTSILARAAAVPDARLSILVTDHHFHAFWCVPGADQYFVGRPQMRKALIALGVPRGAVHVTGIPIDPSFAVRRTRAEAEAQADLPTSPFRVLVMGGGLGLGPIEKIVARLGEVRTPHQTVVVAGHNRRLDRRLRARGDGVVVYGYTDRIPVLMAASDLCITKPGGLTVAEAAAMGLPSVIVEPLPGHEEANTEILVREGSAFRMRSTRQVAEVVEQLARRPRLLRRMARRMGRYGMPHAAERVASYLEDLWTARFASCGT